MRAGTALLTPIFLRKEAREFYDRISRDRVNAPGQPLKIRIEVLAMPMGELPLDEVASQPSEVDRPVLVHSCCRLGHSCCDRRTGARCLAPREG